ncbi:hypothetical protein GQX74_009394 [Glossina fuscipes]|nr:hypothetical protein GQX74_009394 [Glossina fuscipes]
MGSIDRYGAMLHDGSEYTGSYTEKLTKRQIQQWHRTRIEAVLSGVVDGLVVETILCQMEAEAVTEMLLKDYADVKFWVSFQCKDELLLAHGQNFANSAKTNIYINNEQIPPLIVYSNRGEMYDALKSGWTGHDKCVPLASYGYN